MRLFLAMLLLLLSTNTLAKDITLNDQNTVVLRGPVTSQSVGDVMSELSALSKVGDSKDPIYLILNTPGGSVTAGIQLIEYMNTLRRPVHSVVQGMAASMGFQILQNSNIRYVTKYGTVMSHQASIGGVQGNLPGQVNSRLKSINDLVRVLDEQAVARTKGKHTLKSYQELIRDEYYAVGKSAVEDGFADEVVSLKCDESLDGTVTKNVQVFIFSVEVEFSKCPLITTAKVKNKEREEDTLRYLDSIVKMSF
jgi:ATP-dependent Clp protease protease subunit